MTLMEKQKLPLYKRFFLSPLAWAWKSVYFSRRAFYDYGLIKNKSFHVPIISVGNLTFGGTGKTPFTLWLAQYLHSQNKKVMILMRGYKGNLENSSGIIESDKMMQPDPSDYGDEALIFAKRLKNATVVVGKNRVQNLSHYFPKVTPDVVLLDDGHQHLKIKRKLNIVLFDATMPLYKYFVAPLGYMREDFSALKDADLIVIGKADIAGQDRVDALKEKLKPHLPYGVDFAEIGFRSNGFYNSAGKKILNVEDIKDRKVIALAGIGNPGSFFKTIEKLGAEVIVTEAFKDHHYFKIDEIKALLDYAKTEDALLITTEKDMVRIRNIIEDESILYLEIDLHFISGEEIAKKVIDSCFKNFY